MQARCRWVLTIGLMLAALIAGLALVTGVSAQPSGGIELEQSDADLLAVAWPEAAGADRYALRWHLFGRSGNAQTVELPASVRRYQLTGLRQREIYSLRVQALSADGAVLQTWSRTALTRQADARWWHARLRSADGSLHLSWEPPAAWSPDGYRVRWRHVDTLTWQPTVDVGADVRTYTITGLNAGQSYTVRLSAFQIAVPPRLARPSNVASAVQPPPAAPTLTAQTAASGSVKLSWEAGDGGAASWQYRQQPSGGSWSAWTTIPAADAVTASHTVSGLTEDERHDFQLRAVNPVGAGLPSGTTSAVAGLTPTTFENSEATLHDHLGLSGSASRAGAYALLTDVSDLSSGVTTFAQIGDVNALRINPIGYEGRNYTEFLDTIQVGDYVTWRPARKCWYHFRVTAILNASAGHKFYRIALDAEDPCWINISQKTDPHYLNLVRTGFASFTWRDGRPDAPPVGSDGIRILPHRQAVEGGHTYRLQGLGGPTHFVIDLAAEVRLRQRGYAWGSDGSTYVSYLDEVSGIGFVLTAEHGEILDYFTEPGYSGAAAGTASEDAIARFKTLINIRVQPLP